MKHGLLVYDRRAQNLKFVALMPEQMGTLTLHFPEVSGGTYAPLRPWEKCIVVVGICSGMGATNSIPMAPTDFSSWTILQANLIRRDLPANCCEV